MSISKIHCKPFYYFGFKLGLNGSNFIKCNCSELVTSFKVSRWLVLVVS